MADVFSEGDRDRLARRISAIAAGDLTNRQIADLIDGDIDLLRGLPTSTQQGVAALLAPKSTAEGQLEKMVGPTIDFVPVAYLSQARRAGDAVARVVTAQRRATGTGVMVSPRLFMTNNHVLPSAEAATGHLLQFEYELAANGAPTGATEFALDPATFFWTSAETELDATVVAVGQRLTGDRPLEAFGWCALSSAGDKHAEGDHVSIIQHPDGDYKQVALRENRVIGRGAKGHTLHYGADTLPGSSGSPVFNDQFSLVALHHAGGPRNEQHLDSGQPVPPDSNEGIRISSIVEALQVRHDDLPPAIREVLAQALNPPVTVAPLESAVATQVPGTAPTLQPLDTSHTGTSLSVVGPVVADLQLPVRISFGAQSQPTTRTEPAGPGQIERNAEPDPAYENRRGYDPDFLTAPVPLPLIPAPLLANCAQLVKSPGRRTSEDVVLPYHHFSLVVRADRQMPLFTIVNIDGRKTRSINRETGEVEASETWFADPRIDATAHLAQTFFANQQPRIFDRGHLVRRLDPAWGSPSVAKSAADDTFHFTNCSPQISAFNQHLWLSIESYALDNASDEKQRITVISGPVFGTDDPTYREIAIPRAFWKIVVRIEHGQLRATAFLADQSSPLDEALTADGVEAFDDLGSVAAFQKSVTEIETLSGLHFGSLREHDAFTGGLETTQPLVTLRDAIW